MAEVGGYFLRIISVALICAILTSLQSSGTGASRLIQLVAGLVLSLCVVTPLGGLSFTNFPESWDLEIDQGTHVVSDGKNMAWNEQAEIISKQTEAYILDKANDMGLEVEVSVTLEGDTWPVPVAVLLSGRASPYHRRSMEDMLSRDFGLARENVRWTE